MKEKELNKKYIENNLINQKLENEMNINNDFHLTNQNYEMMLSNKIEEIKLINEKLEDEQKIICNFFSFYNQYIDTINDLNFLNCSAEMIDYDINDEKLNIKYSMYIINILNKLISKIMLDNKEMYEIISETKTMLNEKDQNLKKFMMEISQLNEIKNENNYLKQQVNDLINQINLTRNYY